MHADIHNHVVCIVLVYKYVFGCLQIFIIVIDKVSCTCCNIHFNYLTIMYVSTFTNEYLFVN